MSSGSSIVSCVAIALAAVACGSSPPPPAETAKPAAPAPEAGAKKASEDNAASKAAAIETLASGEAKSGTCDDGHKAALEKLLEDVENGMKAKNGEDGKPLGLQLV